MFGNPMMQQAPRQTMTQQSGAPSRVLLIRCHDVPGEMLLDSLLQYTVGMGELPMFCQPSKGIAFVQFPSAECASQILELINSGSIAFPTARSVTAEFSTRTEVNTRKRPGDDVLESMNKRAPTVHATSKSDIAPSMVICVKTDQSEAEALQLFNPLGLEITDSLFVLGKNMVFVEFKNIPEATTALQFIQKSQITTATGYNVDAMYSLRKQITKENKIVGVSLPPTAATTVSNPMMAETKPKNLDCPPNRVLLVSLKAMMSTGPPTVDNLMVPFSHCGMIEKMIVFNKQNSVCQALIQYSSIEYAEVAMQRYQGQQMGAYKLTIHFSERPELDIVQNNSRMRDFMNPWLPEAQTEL